MGRSLSNLALLRRRTLELAQQGEHFIFIGTEPRWHFGTRF